MTKLLKITHFQKTPQQVEPCVATIGNFDGLHLGHQSIIENVIQKAHHLSLKPTVITFEPSPQMVLRPQAAFSRLMTFSQKLQRLSLMGIEQVVCCRFTSGFARISPQQFISDILEKQLLVRHLYIGEGFKFGHQQKGTVQTLRENSEQGGFEVHPIAHIQSDFGKISSSLIRQAVQDANFDWVQKCLGRPFSITSRVVKGAKRGSAMGFATANLAFHPASLLLKGVFVTNIIIDNKVYQGVANSGTRPTVDGTKHITEVHIFDFQDDLYNKKISIEVLHKIRDEKRFDSIEQLKQQIREDIQKARAFFDKSKLKLKEIDTNYEYR